MSDLIVVCYFVNLANDLEKWLAHGTVDSDILAQLGEELREIAQALDTEARFHRCQGFRFRATPRIVRVGVRAGNLPSTTRSSSD